VPGQEGRTVQFSGTRTVKATRTSEQLTALANSADLKAWKYYPYQNVQIRVNNDGSVEASGRLLSDRLSAALARPGLDMTAEERGYVNDYGKYIKGNPALYVKFKGGVSNNKVDINFSKVEAGGIGIPSEVMGEVNSHVKNLAERKMVRVPGLNIKSLTFQNGKMNFDGTVPDKIYMQH
jgi:Zn-finger domain-containing protein